ncbi:GON1 protein, partial [Psophia crepitans]|nr:GON1 protein [Psophia crepitans]
MDKSRKIFIGAILLVMSMEICLAQHWSYGLQPGGKRNAENVAEAFQETANEMAKPGEAQKSDCPGSYQRSRFSDLKEVLETLIEGEARRKKI